MTQHLPEPVRKLIHLLAELPSIGPRQATRLVFYLLNQGKPALEEVAQAIKGLHAVKTCSRCYFIHQEGGNICDICTDPARDQSIIMIVEKETDLISLEKAGKFKGRYLVLGAIPKIGVMEDWQKARLASLTSFIKKELGPSTGSGQGTAKEIILGFNPTSLGDFNASLITKELSGMAKKMTRLGRGLPTGGEIEFADDDTLGAALERRN
jgi:recombination protein RecR